MSQYGRITNFLILLGFLALLLAGLSAPHTYAQTPAQPATKVKLDLVDHSGGPSQSIFATEAYIYTNFGRQFAILERIDDTTFRRVGFTLLGDPIDDIHVDGQYAYVTGWGSVRLGIIDISDPANPQVVAHVKFEWGWMSDSAVADDTHDPNTESIVVADGHAYLGSAGGYAIIDVSDPARPTLVHTCTCDVAGPIEVQDTLLYGRYGEPPYRPEGLAVYDISDPKTPSLLGTYRPENSPLDLSVQGQFAYVTTNAGLDIVSIANPQEPALVKHIEPETDLSEHSRFNLVVDGQYAYVVLPGNQLWIVDISTPSEPQTASLTPLPVTNDDIVPHAITKVGSNLYLALQHAGFMVLDVTDPTAPNHIITSASYSLPVGGFVHLKAPYLYAGRGIFDISDPASPQLAGQYHGEIRLMQGQYGFGVTPYDHFAIFDLSRPLTPTITGTYPITDFGPFAVANNHAYVVQYVEDHPIYPDERLDILDISDPAQPRRVAIRKDIVPNPSFIARGSYLYTSQDGSFHIYDISNPVAPRKVSAYRAPPGPSGYARVGDFSIKGNFAFLATDDGGLRILDLQDPANPVEVGSHPSHATKVLDVTDTYAYVTSEEHQGEDVLNVIDITDITDPETVGRHLYPPPLFFPQPGSFHIGDIVAVGEYVYYTGDGLYTLHQQEIELPLRTYLPVSSVADR